jgi:ATP synthase in type III secretion protein N
MRVTTGGQVAEADTEADTPMAVRGTLSNVFERALAKPIPVERVGRVAEAHGTIIKVVGVNARIGELCILRNPHQGFELRGEVIGITSDYTLVTPLGNLAGLSTETEVYTTGQSQQVPVGDALLGRVVSATLEPLDGRPLAAMTGRQDIYAAPPNPLKRQPIDRALPTGVRAIDSLLTCGEGQRVGIFAAAGGGKSTLLGMLARGTAADIVVVALVGERGREVNEFLDDNLGEVGRRKSVVVVATADRPALERARAALVATAIAEHFRDQGKRVLLMVDSITRHARALRDLGLAIGELPARRGFPPSVYSALPQLFERAGNGERGSITAFYSTLLEDEEQADPIAEEVRSLLDGHIILSRKLGNAGHFPAIDVLGSVSRLMSRIATPAHQLAATEARKSLAKYREIELLLQLGEYRKGSDADADIAIGRWAQLNAHLKQSAAKLETFDDGVASLDKALVTA